MAAVSPVAAYSPAQQAVFPTPSPFSFSVASTRWSSRPSVHLSNLFLRAMALVLSFASALALAAKSSKNSQGQEKLTLQRETKFIYSFVVTTSAFLYSAYQLFKGICDIAYRGILISDVISDNMNFILDQLAAYLLISGSSVTTVAIQQLEESTPLSLRKAAIVSVCMSFSGFLVFAACALLSGYKLCKRIIW